MKTEVLKASTEIHWFGEFTTTSHLFYKNIPTVSMNVPFLGSWSYRAGVFPPTVPLGKLLATLNLIRFNKERLVMN